MIKIISKFFGTESHSKESKNSASLKSLFKIRFHFKEFKEYIKDYKKNFFN